MNLAVVAGQLTRLPEERVLPSGARLVTLDLTVRRPHEKAETVNLCWVDAPAWAVTLEVGQTVVARGRVRRRFFRAGGATQSRTEIVVEALAPVRQAKKVRALLAAAALALDDAVAAPPDGRG